VVKEGETPPPALTVRVCDSLTCEMMGAQALLGALQHGVDASRVRVVRAPCMGHCDAAPVAEVGHHYVLHATQDEVAAAIAAGHSHADLPAGGELPAYRAGGGYRLLEACRAGRRSFEELVGFLGEAGLRGLGGAGFPTGRTWGFGRQEAGPR
jgi:formate dehydrogenase